MTPDSPLLIEVPETRDRLSVGEAFPLRLVIQRPPDRTGPVVIPYFNHTDSSRVSLDTDLFQREVTLHPGECLELTVGVEFRTAGPANLRDFYVQADPPDGGRGDIVRLPDRNLRVLPSMRPTVQVTAERICAYDQAVKMEVVVRNTGAVAWEDFVIGVGPAGKVRSGVTRHRRPRLETGQTERFEVVLAPGSLELTLAGTTNGDRIVDKQIFRVALEGETSQTPVLFQFLEPRALTSDQVTIRGDEDGVLLVPRRGVYPITGAGKTYRVTIHPNDATAEDVDLLGTPGHVEVKKMKSENREWSFLVTPLDSPLIPQFARIYYDVKIPGRVLRGELYLAVQPANAKLWTLAATAGAALTIKGITGVLQTALTPDHGADDLWFDIVEQLRRNWTNGLQLLSIPLFRFGLSLVSRISRWYRGW